MIQLANDPNASRSAFRPAARGEAKANGSDALRSRSGHAWPFLSRHAGRPAQKDNPKPVANDNGS
jgi:hypothetical protein